jgi:hypothetical protein
MGKGGLFIYSRVRGKQREKERKQRYIPENSKLHARRRENLKSHDGGLYYLYGWNHLFIARGQVGWL